MSLTGFHPLWDKIVSQNLQAVADQGCHLEGSSPCKGTAYRGYTVLENLPSRQNPLRYLYRKSSLDSHIAQQEAAGPPTLDIRALQ
jgi:hypothetical protein